MRIEQTFDDTQGMSVKYAIATMTHGDVISVTNGDKVVTITARGDNFTISFSNAARSNVVNLFTK